MEAGRNDKLTKHQRGFSLIELLIVVAIIGIIAAIAIPGLLRARISANEASMIGDIRAVISAQSTYASANGQAYESALSCLGQGGGCIPGSPPGSPTFLDSVLARALQKSGYDRAIVSIGPAPNPRTAAMSPTSAMAYVYAGTPATPGRTGVRGFAGDDSGLICFTNDSTVPANANGVLTVASCNALR